MNWKNLFTPVATMNSAEARDYIDSHASGTFQLVDVRQPAEYEKKHIPGATLIPLAELPGRIKELNPSLPTIAYCAIGGRSRAASQLLAAQGFSRVFNLGGGIKAWEDRTATGPRESGLNLIDPETDFPDALTLAYAMEDGLQRFYLASAAATGNKDMQKIFSLLGEIEDNHKKRLQAKLPDKSLAPAAAPKNSAPGSDTMEGGYSIASLLKTVKDEVTTPSEIFDLAMMLETQALDLYGRLADQSSGTETRDLFLQLADEEKAHLKRLARELDTLLGG